MITLRDYQQDAVQSAYAYWQNGTSCIIEAPCGAGKSLIIGKICHDSITHDVRVLVVTHRKKLLEQNEAELKNLFQKLENGHDMLSRDYSRLNDAIVKISESLMALVVIQEQNKSIMQCMEHQSTTIEKLDARIDAIELQMPQLVESRQWLMIGLGLIVTAVIVALIALVIK